MDVKSHLVNGNQVKAFGIRSYGGVSELTELTIPYAPFSGRDIRVLIKAVAVNPVDAKVRTGYKGSPIQDYQVLGYDGAGIVVEVGPSASLFKVGDRVMYSGSLLRSGTNAELAVVDEQLVGRMPADVSFAEAAALPLTALTAWEGLFEQLGLQAYHPSNKGKRILVLPGAGGVGSIVIQLAAKVLGLFTIATASRAESVAHCKNLGAHLVINHREPLKAQLDAAGVDGVDYIFNGYDMAVYTPQYIEIIKPFGKLVSILESLSTLSLTGFMAKRATITFELMFTRSLFGIDMIQQHYILENVAHLVESQVLKGTATTILPYTIENLRKAHEIMESEAAIGKVVLTTEQ